MEFVFFFIAHVTVSLSIRRNQTALWYFLPSPLSNCQIYVFLLKLQYFSMIMTAYNTYTVQLCVFLFKKKPHGDVSLLPKHVLYNNIAILFEWRRSQLTWAVTHPGMYLPNHDPVRPFQTRVHICGLCGIVLHRQVTDAHKNGPWLLPAFSGCSDWWCFSGLLHVLTNRDTEWF